jgi:predicted signal transduction protein with EAL and GGDEF domain
VSGVSEAGAPDDEAMPSPPSDEPSSARRHSPEVPAADEVRDAAAEQRDLAAEKRDADAARRDAVAEDRDAIADARDRAQPDHGPTKDEARRDRERSAGDRVEAEEDREEAAADREAATEDRHASQEARQANTLDELTGVYRRRAGVVELEREIGRARRTNAALALAFVDVDGLKAVNDAQGHAAGIGCCARWPTSCGASCARTT